VLSKHTLAEGAKVNLKLELLESQIDKVSFIYTPSNDTKRN
jgi:hypothetical protein